MHGASGFLADADGEPPKVAWVSLYENTEKALPELYACERS